MKSLAQSTIRSWYMTTVSAGPDDNGDLAPYHFGSVTSDVMTGNFGNFGMRFNNLEPRIPYGNSSAGSDRAVTETPWNYNYGTIGATNDVLRALKAGVSLGSPGLTEQYKQEAQFAQAASYTYLAMEFDRAFVVTENNDPAVPTELSPYTDVRDSTLRMWKDLIAATATSDFTYEVTDLPLVDGALTSRTHNRIANTMAAMVLAYSPRIPSQSASVDWAAVAAFADKGIGTGSAGRSIRHCRGGRCQPMVVVCCGVWRPAGLDPDGSSGHQPDESIGAGEVRWYDSGPGIVCRRSLHNGLRLPSAGHRGSGPRRLHAERFLSQALRVHR